MRDGPTHDVIVIGGSSGAIEALNKLLPVLPADLPAAIFIVVHVGEASVLPAVLRRRSALPVEPARSGVAFEHGRVHVAIPGAHLLLHDDHILLRRGPRENHARPAVDALFRTAAASCGSRVIGVVLSGSLADGTAGLRAIKRCGGLAVVQKPEEASAPSMPRSAIRNVDVDHVRAVAEMPALLARLTREPAKPSPEVPADIRLEAAIAAREHGALWEIHDGPMLRYRCHVGHAFTADTVLAGQNDEIDRMLETLQRAHQERAALARRMVERERAEQRHGLADHLETRAREYEDDAKLVLELMRSGFGAAAPDEEGAKAGGNGKDEA